MQNTVVIPEDRIDKIIKNISDTLLGKDKDIIYSNSKTKDFINGFMKNGDFKMIIDDKLVEVSFVNESWCKDKKTVIIHRTHPGKFSKSKRLAITLLCKLIVEEHLN